MAESQNSLVVSLRVALEKIAEAQKGIFPGNAWFSYESAKNSVIRAIVNVEQAEARLQEREIG